MKSHITKAEQEKAFDKALQEQFKKVSNNSFALGAKAISKMALNDYIPAIENAETDEQRTQAIADLKRFLGVSDNLKVETEQEGDTANENSQSV